MSPCVFRRSSRLPTDCACSATRIFGPRLTQCRQGVWWYRTPIEKEHREGDARISSAMELIVDMSPFLCWPIPNVRTPRLRPAYLLEYTKTSRRSMPPTFCVFIFFIYHLFNACFSRTHFVKFYHRCENNPSISVRTLRPICCKCAAEIFVFPLFNVFFMDTLCESLHRPQTTYCAPMCWPYIQSRRFGLYFVAGSCPTGASSTWCTTRISRIFTGRTRGLYLGLSFVHWPRGTRYRPGKFERALKRQRGCDSDSTSFF